MCRSYPWSMRTVVSSTVASKAVLRSFVGTLTVVVIGMVSLYFVIGQGAARPAVANIEVGAHVALRSARHDGALLTVRGWPHEASAHFVTYYQPGEASAAATVIQAAETDYPIIAADFDLPRAGARHALVVVSADAMARHVTGTSDDPPLGAYYDGVVWLLAPSAFLAPGPDLAQRYDQAGPVAHELTHLADDISSGGRIPPWFDEGLAQYEDWRLTGYVWVEDDNSFGDQTYSWNQLAIDFVSLPNQALAYRQALAATARICRVGPGVCVHVLNALRHGASLPVALSGVLGSRGLTALESGAAWQPGREPEPGAVAGPKP